MGIPAGKYSACIASVACLSSVFMGRGFLLKTHISFSDLTILFDPYIDLKDVNSLWQTKDGHTSFDTSLVAQGV